MLKLHVLDGVYRHSSNVAHGVEVPAQVVFARLEAVLAAAKMSLSDIARLTVFLTDQADVGTFVEIRDRVMAGHKPGAIILVVKALARAELKIEIEAVAAKVD